MFNLAQLSQRNLKTVFVKLSDEATAKRFLQDAERQGFIFSDGAKPTSKAISDFFAVHHDKTVNYIGFIGRVAYMSNSENIIRLDYSKVLKINDKSIYE